MRDTYYDRPLCDRAHGSADAMHRCEDTRRMRHYGPEPTPEPLVTHTSPCSRPILDARTPAWVARNVQRGGPIRATKELTR